MNTGHITTDALRRTAGSLAELACQDYTPARVRELASAGAEQLGTVAQFLENLHKGEQVHVTMVMTAEESEWFEDERARRRVAKREGGYRG